eukprot:495017-Pelagomonas_calceolata.AAC.1
MEGTTEGMEGMEGALAASGAPDSGHNKARVSLCQNCNGCIVRVLGCNSGPKYLRVLAIVFQSCKMHGGQKFAPAICQQRVCQEDAITVICQSCAALQIFMCADGIPVKVILMDSNRVSLNIQF